jgi:hypothetical protein
MKCLLDTHRPNNTVFLAGCGRSGTTWLGDLINYRNHFRVMFEPFYPREVPELRIGWNPQQYIRPDAPDGPETALVRRILAGRLCNTWVDQFNRRRVATRRLIKDIRANYLLGWVHAQYPAIPLVYIIRHPIPTVLSQLKLGWPLGFRFCLQQPDLMADHLEPHRAFLAEEMNPFEARLTAWCLMNLVPLRQFAGGGLHLVLYEELCQKPHEVLPALFRYIGEEYRPWILDILSVPSRLSKGHSAVVKGGDKVSSWQDEVTPEQMTSALRILARFGFDRIYGAEPEPRLTAEQVPSLFK